VLRRRDSHSVFCTELENFRPRMGQTANPARRGALLAGRDRRQVRKEREEGAARACFVSAAVSSSDALPVPPDSAASTTRTTPPRARSPSSPTTRHARSNIRSTSISMPSAISWNAASQSLSSSAASHPASKRPPESRRRHSSSHCPMDALVSTPPRGSGKFNSRDCDATREAAPIFEG
jgi:hypothetical protein